ncbi:MAG: hypothetical protein NC517_06135 [Firmicutes bacterium]|nr:hypothetical protein [Bacillota bacterium]
MKFKKVIAASAVTCAMLASTLTVSAAGLRDVFDARYYADKYADLKAAFGYDEKALYQHYLTYGTKEGRTMSPVLDVAAYRAAYSDLEAAFGDDWDAYVEHYLTFGIKEHRTEGILFDPLAYAEAYPDIKEAFGDDVEAIIRHYLTFGINEGRTAGVTVVGGNSASSNSGSSSSSTGSSSNTGSGSSMVEHVHTFSEEWESDGTNHWHPATCGHDVKSDEAAHTESAPFDVEATCTTPGATGRVVCTVCDEVLDEGTEVPVDEDAHTFAEEWESDGTNHWHAATCGHDVKDGETTHTEVPDTDKNKEATCGETGWENATKCSVCDRAMADGNLLPVDESKHTFAEEWESDGTNHWHAATCGHDVKDGETTHTEVPDTDKNKEATCGETGWENATKCSVCDRAMADGNVLPVDASKHTFSEEWESDGTKHWHAATCGHDVKNGEADHTEVDDDEVNKPATCTEAGVEGAKKCSVCEVKTNAGTPIAAKGHTEVDDDEVNKPATCTEAGVEEAKKCSVCEAKTNAGTPIAAKGHIEVDDDEVNKPATCTEAGVEGAKKCSVCEAKTNAGTPIAVKEHTDDDGDKACDDCGASLTD